MIQKTFFNSTRLWIIFLWIALFAGVLYIPPLFDSLFQENSITVLTWAEMIDPDIVSQFERESGIKVKLRFFESNEELFVKMLMTKTEGFDIVLPSDYIIEKLINYSLIKPINKEKLLFWNRINPALLDKFFDPGNVYSIPYYWAVYGLGINTTFFKNLPVEKSWRLLFNNGEDSYKVAMVNTAREAVLIAARYALKSLADLSPQNLPVIEQLLKNQKKYVDAYVDADVRAEYLLTSGSSGVAVIATPFLVNTFKENQNIEFIVPKEGSFILLDNIVVASATKKEEEIYKFINYLFQRENLKVHFSKYPFFPTTDDFFDFLDEFNVHESIKEAHKNLEHFDFFKSAISEEVINKLWMKVKAV